MRLTFAALVTLLTIGGHTGADGFRDRASAGLSEDDPVPMTPFNNLVLARCAAKGPRR
jgi:hypothetical protein